MVTRRYRVFGRVQGVGFRRFTFEVAQELKLRGWVQNRPDGTVEVLAAGSSPRLDLFKQMLIKGPDRSEVLEITEADERSPCEFQSFTIIRDESAL